MSGVPYTFASATSSIPLSQLDANFATNATLGNATVGLGNTTTTVGNLTVSNVTINGLSGGGANGVVYINSSNVATANASVLALDNSGNLGIGTTSPVNNSGYGGLTLNGTSGSIYSMMYNGTENLRLFAGNGQGSIQYTSSGFLSFTSGVSGGTERMRLDSSGNLLVGTTSSSAKLTVSIGASTSGTVARFSAPSYDDVYIAAGSSTTSCGIGTVSSSAFNLFVNSTARATIDSSGNLVVPQIYNNTTSNSANTYIGSSGTLQRSSSALKYKTNVRDLPQIDITKFRPVVYNSLCDGDDKTVDHFGFIADEVDQAGYKQLVSYGAQGEVEGFQYERMTAVLTQQVQQLLATVTTLQSQVAALQAKVGA